MALKLRGAKRHPDAAPIWLPRHDSMVVEQASSQPPSSVQGYSLQSRLFTALLGSRWKMASVAGTALAVLLFFATVPSLFGAGIGSLIKIAIYQAWTLGLMLLVTARVRTVSAGTAARYWLAGMFSVAMVTFFVNDVLAGLSESSSVWITPVLEELVKAAPLAVAVFMGRRAWRHPGMSDLMILGFAVGGGYAFHSDGLWERAAASGFGFDAGLLVPTIYRPDGAFPDGGLIVGHAVWTALIGLVIGLAVLHRRQAPAVVVGGAVGLAVLLDHMSVADTEGTLDVARQLLFNGKLLALVFVVGLAAAVLLDQRRLAETGLRDHLFPSDRAQSALAVETEADDDLLKLALTSRYRRLRNGIHTTVNATTQQWPPHSESHPAPIAELARLARAAEIAVGPGTASTGWAPDPETPHGFRFVGPDGFTAYAAGEVVLEPTPAAALAPLFQDPDIDDERRAELERQAAASAHALAAGPTATSISIPKARIDATGTPSLTRPDDYWQYVGLGVVVVALYTLVRLLTAGDPTALDLDTTLNLPDAELSPALIRGVLGAAAAAVAIRGRDMAVLGAGSDVGPSDDPTPDRPEECEA